MERFYLFMTRDIRYVVTGFMFALLLSAVVPTDAQAAQTQSKFFGAPTCGTYNLDTKRMMSPCGTARATYAGKARGTCPRGSFFDIGTWSCYTCPPGYNRTAYAVDTPQACSKEIPIQYKRAIAIDRQKKCGGVTFWDARNGGECWKCPSGYGRTASAVDAWDACGMVLKKARRATFVSRVCPENTFPDPNGSCYVCPDGYNRTAGNVTKWDACMRNEDLQPATKAAALTCKAGQHFDLIDGGTCWTCPEGSTRTMSGVKAGDACAYTTYRWDPAKRDTRGLFELPGADKVTAQVVANRTLIDQTIAKMAKAAKKNPDKLSKDAWALIDRAPGDSPILKAAVLARVIELINNHPKTDAERQLLSYIADYVRDTRRLSVKEMQRIWESLKRAHAERAKKRTGHIATLYDLGPKPPEMNQLAGQVALLSSSGVATLSVATVTAAAGQTMLSGSAGLMAQSAINAVMPYVAFETSKVAAASVASMAGPASIVAGAAIIAGMSYDIVAQQEKMDATIADGLKRAENPVNLALLLRTPEGRTELANNWALMTQNPSRPAPVYISTLKTTTAPAKPPAGKNLGVEGMHDFKPGDTVVIDSSTTGIDLPTGPTGSSGPGKTWAHVNGKARDVAVSADGTIWHISLADVSPAGGAMYYKAPKASGWKEMRGQGTRVAFLGAEPWHMNTSGRMYRLQNGAWKGVDGPTAIDIGGSPKSMWMVGGGKTAGGYQIFQFNGRSWNKVPGGAVRIAVAGSQPWVVNDRGHVYRRDGSNWTLVSKSPVAVDIGAGSKGVWILGKQQGPGGNKIYYFDGKGWKQVPGEATALDIGPDGLPFTANKLGDMYARK